MEEIGFIIILLTRYRRNELSESGKESDKDEKERRIIKNKDINK